MAKSFKSMQKIKVLMYCDSPTCATGFGNVSRNIAEALHRTGKYDIDVLGINFFGDPHNFPYRIWPVMNNNDRDPYGRKKVFNMIPQMDFDILFFLQDSFILDFLPPLHDRLRGEGKKFKSIAYYPIDGTPKLEWLKDVNAVDYLVAYTEFGARLSQAVYPNIQDLRVIPHGANVIDFKPLPKNEVKEFKSMYFGKHADRFIVTNVNRNQQRKDIPRSIAAFREFKKECPNSLLYLHMAIRDQGWDLAEVVKSYGFSISEDVIFPENFGPNQGYPVQILNLIYNASDLVVSTSIGEGFGLGWVESMSTKTPVLMPDNTAMTEFITEDKGYLAKSGSNPSLFTVMPHDNEVIRPLVDVEDMAQKMIYIYNNYDEALQKANRAYHWVKDEMTWQGKIGMQWTDLFNEAIKSLRSDKVNNLTNSKKFIEAEVI